MQLYFSSSWERGKRGSLITTFNQAVSSNCWSAMPILNYLLQTAYILQSYILIKVVKIGIVRRIVGGK